MPSLLSVDVSRSTTPAAPVLIAVAFWDSSSVTVFSFAAPSTTSSTSGPARGDRQAGSKSPCGTAAVEKVASWHPPWGGSSPLPGAVDDSGASHDEADAGTATVMGGVRGEGGVALLTRALAIVRFGTGPEQMSLVAATADGAVAVAEWSEGRGGGQGGTEEEKGCGGRTGDNCTSNKSCLRGALVTVASFQVGRGPVRLEVFPAAGGIGEVDNANGGGGERLFVNGDVVDAVVCWCLDTAGTTPNQCRGGWQCTQVGTSLCTRCGF